MTTFAERLKNAMEQANMSQSALSEQAGASKAAISQYLSGKNTPGHRKASRRHHRGRCDPLPCAGGDRQPEYP